MAAGTQELKRWKENPQAQEERSGFIHVIERQPFLKARLQEFGRYELRDSANFVTYMFP